MKKKRTGSREKVRIFLLKNMGRKLNWQEIRAAAGGVEQWSRRLRELRDDQGYQILSHRDRADLKPGEYLIETDKRRPIIDRSISKEDRAWILERNGYTCQMCGLGAGDQDPYNSSRKVRLTMGHIIDKSKGGEDARANLRAVCSNCNEGLQNTAPPKPDRVHLLSQIRRARIDDQAYILDWLKKKFKKTK